MNVSREGESPETDFSGILQKGIIRSENSESISSPVDLSSYAIDRTPLKELPGVLEKIVREICLVNTRTQDRNSSQTQLSREIKKYISLNFVDPELNISAIGHHFALTPPYVSLIFKEETGMNMLDYINTFRVEKAKELLEKGLTVKETGEQVGFRRSNTFIRIFKGITGITPKRYQAVRKI
jgi:YesN/AraC family two-component response regulator